MCQKLGYMKMRLAYEKRPHMQYVSNVDNARTVYFTSVCLMNTKQCFIKVNFEQMIWYHTEDTIFRCWLAFTLYKMCNKLLMLMVVVHFIFPHFILFSSIPVACHAQFNAFAVLSP